MQRYYMLRSTPNFSSASVWVIPYGQPDGCWPAVLVTCAQYSFFAISPVSLLAKPKCPFATIFDTDWVHNTKC